MASTVPAAVLGLGDRGRLEVGRRAVLVLWSDTLEIVSTVVGGQVLSPDSKRDVAAPSRTR
jgi:N-acetylglucosamine-6-phosphate deacetylase